MVSSSFATQSIADRSVRSLVAAMPKMSKSFGIGQRPRRSARRRTRRTRRGGRRRRERSLPGDGAPARITMRYLTASAIVGAMTAGTPTARRPWYSAPPRSRRVATTATWSGKNAGAGGAAQAFELGLAVAVRPSSVHTRFPPANVTWKTSTRRPDWNSVGWPRFSPGVKRLFGADGDLDSRRVRVGVAEVGDVLRAVAADALEHRAHRLALGGARRVGRVGLGGGARDRDRCAPRGEGPAAGDHDARIRP